MSDTGTTAKPLRADNDDLSPDRKRIVARLATRFFLQGLTLARGLARGDILDGLIMLTIAEANTRHMNIGEGEYTASSQIPPDEERKPVSVYLAARELGLSYETVRRHVQRLIKNGLVERVADGVIIPGRVFADPMVMQLTARNSANVRKLIDSLKQIGVE